MTIHGGIFIVSVNILQFTIYFKQVLIIIIYNLTSPTFSPLSHTREACKHNSSVFRFRLYDCTPILIAQLSLLQPRSDVTACPQLFFKVVQNLQSMSLTVFVQSENFPLKYHAWSIPPFRLFLIVD